jgi:hypothetical protein
MTERKGSKFSKQPDSKFIPFAIAAIDKTNVPPALRQEIDTRIRLFQNAARNGQTLTAEQIALMSKDMEEPGL